MYYDELFLFNYYQTRFIIFYLLLEIESDRHKLGQKETGWIKDGRDVFKHAAEKPLWTWADFNTCFATENTGVTNCFYLNAQAPNKKSFFFH